MVKKAGFYGFYSIVILFCIWITRAGFTGGRGSIRGKAVLGLFCFVAICFLGYTCAKSAEISEKMYRKICAVFFLLFFIRLTLFGIRTMTPAISDLEVLIEAVDYMLEHGNTIPYSYYFTVCENTLGNAVFIWLMFIPVHMLGINIYTDTAECWGIMINCLMIILCVYLCLKICEKIIKNRNFNLLFLVLCRGYIPFYLWSHRYYSDTLSLPFVPLAVLLYSKARECTGGRKILFSALCGLTLWSGYFIKGNVIITLIAIAVFSLFADGKDFFKTGLRVVTAFAITLNGMDYIIKHNQYIDYSNYEIDKYPMTMWFLYGAHDDGNYNDFDVDLLRACPDYTTRKAVATEKLKEYYSKYDFKSYIQFLNHKFSLTWGNGMFDSEKYLCFQRHANFTHSFLLEGQPLYSPFRYLCDGLNLALLIMLVLSLFAAAYNRQWNMMMLLHIVFLGNILFLCLWETKARYAFSSMPIVLISAVFALYQVFMVLKPAKDNTAENKTDESIPEYQHS